MAPGRRQEAPGIVADSQWIVAFAPDYGYDQCLPGLQSSRLAIFNVKTILHAGRRFRGVGR
jgi:hypothetical protein